MQDKQSKIRLFLKKTDRFLQKFLMVVSFSLIGFLLLKAYCFYQDHKYECKNFYKEIKCLIGEIICLINSLDGWTVFLTLLISWICGTYILHKIQEKAPPDEDDDFSEY
jgi:hypothetical protein